MFTIDEIRIEGEEDGFHLIIFTDDGGPVRYRIGLPDQFHAEVQRTIGRWLDEGEAARVLTPAELRGPDLLLDETYSVLGDLDALRDIERGK